MSRTIKLTTTQGNIVEVDPSEVVNVVRWGEEEEITSLEFVGGQYLNILLPLEQVKAMLR